MEAYLMILMLPSTNGRETSGRASHDAILYACIYSAPYYCIGRV